MAIENDHLQLIDLGASQFTLNRMKLDDGFIVMDSYPLVHFPMVFLWFFH